MSIQTIDRRLVILVLVIFGALLILPAFFMGFGMMGMGPMMGWMWGDGMWGAGRAAPGWTLIVSLGMQLLFLAVIVGAGYLVYRAVTGSTTGQNRALEELRLAYARGDLTDEEFETRRDALERPE